MTAAPGRTVVLYSSVLSICFLVTGLRRMLKIDASIVWMSQGLAILHARDGSKR
ncbi:hypothetical protein ABH925_001547 [Streptacidiphilus sp. EB129]